MRKKNARRLISIVFTIIMLFSSMSPLLAAKKPTVVLQKADGIDVTVPVEKGSGHLTRKIVGNDENTGEVIMEVKFSNTLSTEVLIVLDNKTNNTFSSDTAEYLKTFVANSFDNMGGLKMSAIEVDPTKAANATAYGGAITYTDNPSQVISVLNGFKTSPGTGNADLNSALNKAKASFTSTTQNKVVVLVLNSFNKDTVGDFRSTLQSMKDSGIKFIVVLNDFKTNTDNTAAISTLFGAGPTYPFGPFMNIVTSELQSTITNDVELHLAGFLPTPKTNFRFSDTLTTDVVKYFDVSYVGNPTKGIANDYNASARNITWAVDTIGAGETVTFKYKLTLKKNVDSNGFNRNIMTIFNSTWSANSTGYGNISGEYDENEFDCIPVLWITEREIENPKTGVFNNLTPYLIIALLALAGFLFFKNKESINSID